MENKENILVRPRLFQLDSIRFFALATIILSHFGFLKYSEIGNFYETYLHNPTFGVDFFFLLSGFGLLYTSIDRELEKGIKSYIKFAIKKIKKIYPLYIFSLFLSIPYNILSGANPKGIFVKFFLNLTLVQSLTGQSRFSHGINGVCWFLSTLFICYIVAPLLINFIQKKCSAIHMTLFILLINIFVIILISYVFLHLETKLAIQYEKNGSGLFDDFFYGSPYIRVFYVFQGMLIGKLFFLCENIEKNLSFIELVLIVFNILYFFLKASIPLESIQFRLIDVLDVSLVLFVFALCKGVFSKKLASKSILYKMGGGYGMYLYLLHYPVERFIGAFFEKKILYGLPASIVSVFLVLLVTIILSIVLKRLFEKRMAVV